jgi:hypothetical protein
MLPLNGGNVVADIQLIEEMETEDASIASSWKRAFARLYVLDYTDFHFPLLCAPAEIKKKPTRLTKNS